jgi:4-aminobutyrate aminotransferase
VLGYIDGLFETICPPEQVAAIIYEPLLSDGGMMPMPDAFLVGLSERCRRHGIALVADEAKVGLGRTGTMLASEHAGVSPDVVILGKGLGGGLPLSAVIGPAELMDFTERFALQSTHGNPVCAAAGLAVLRTIEDEHLLDNSRVLGERLAAGFRLLASHHEIIGDVRGRGLAIGIELVRDRDTRAPDAGLCARTIEHALEYGALLFSVGMHHNVLQVVPALTLTVAEADHAIEIMDRALSAAVALH